jgi:hypothetical protein
VAALEGASYWIGQFFPASYFLIICRGTFTKALGFADLLAAVYRAGRFHPVLTLLSVRCSGSRRNSHALRHALQHLPPGLEGVEEPVGRQGAADPDLLGFFRRHLHGGDRRLAGAAQCAGRGG